MKKFLLVLLVIAMCVSMFGCSNGGGNQTADGNPPADNGAETTETITEASMPVGNKIDLSTDKGSITFDGIELANPGLVDEANVVVFKFTFACKSDTPIQVQGAFDIKYYQNGIEIKESSWIKSDGGDHYDLCGNYFLELMSGGTNSFGRPVIVKDGSTVTLIVSEKGNPDNYQAMEVDISDFGISASENEKTTEAVVDVDAPKGAIDMSTTKGSIKYIGCEKANAGLVQSDNAVVFKFAFTNKQAKPSQCQSAFSIKYYQNGVEIKEASWIHSDGGDHYNLCSDYFLEIMKDGSITFGRPVEITDNSPVTIIIQEKGVSDNSQKMEVELAF